MALESANVESSSQSLLTPEPTVTGVAITATSDTPAGWLSRNVRNLVLLVLLVATAWIAIGMQNERAQESIVVAFITLAAAKSGASDALKVPGKDG